MRRADFRETCFERDGGCVVPSCSRDAVDSHHILERSLWDNGGYVPDNGASVCSEHHKLAERDIIPPASFWRWIGVTDPPLPSGVESMHVDKWGEPLESPPWPEHRQYIKYPSTRHLPWSHEREADDTAHEAVDCFLDYPLVATVKMDGGNCMLVSDDEHPVRARNGRHADKSHFDMAKQWYWENDLYSKIPDYLQVFGEWLYAKHSIHYGCDCDEPCDDIGPALEDYFQVFGMYDTRYDLWLGWYETEQLADELGLTMVGVVGPRLDRYENRQLFWDDLYELSQDVVDAGHEGIVVRSKLPFHFGQIDRRLGKYVRPGHVSDDEEHWSHRELVRNRRTK